MAATLPYVVVYCSSESSEAPARCLEEPGGGCWVSDARHRFPVEVGLWVGDATLEALRFVAHESLAPRRVEVYVASGEGEAPRDDFSREPEALATLRRRWRGEYGDAVFTRVGAVDFHGDARRDARRPARAARSACAASAKAPRARGAAASAPARRAGRPWPGAARAAEARESAEEMRACAARDDFDGASAEQRRGRALKEERLRVLRARAADDYGGDGAGRDPLSPRRPEDDDDGDLPAPPRAPSSATPGAGTRRRRAAGRREPADVARATTATSRRASTRRARPRRRGATRRTPSSTWRRPRSSARGAARRRVRRTATRPPPPDPVDSESDESDGGAAGSDSEPDANDMTLTDASMMTSTIDGLACSTWSATASRVDGAALGAATDDLALFEVDAERTRRYGAAPDDGGRGTGPPELAPFRRRRLLFAALVALLQQGLADASADVFIAANRLLVDVFKGRAKRNVKTRPRRRAARDDDDDDARLRPWEVLRLGVRSTGSPLREALVALRRLLPLVAQRLPRLRRRDLGEDAFASQAAKRASRRATKTLLKLANLHWLGAAVVAQRPCCRQRRRAAPRDVAGLGDLETYADSAARPIASRRLAAARLRALALLVARSGALGTRGSRRGTSSRSASRRCGATRAWT
ncbi:hypothetical protein SO694_00006558 [Aureococcus anophagefferens]|uniref:Uncharacterized protein n=1 Tax=Aureococcus anophagefferens TaxID=44056 RepID=A0ABR1GAL7_AURAN